MAGIASAAAAQGCEAAAPWLIERQGLLARGRCRIGHVDLLAAPASASDNPGGRAMSVKDGPSDPEE
jgi:hypothetical protein